MPSSQYTKGLQKILNGNVSLLNDNMKFMLVDGDLYLPNLDTHEFISDIPELARFGSSGLITGKVISVDTETTPTPQVYFSCDQSGAIIVPGKVIECVVLYKDTGSASTSPLIAYFNGETILVTSDGSEIKINIGLLGLLRWSR